MLQVTLYQMRKNVGRLTAAGIAILIGTAFVAATFVAGQLLVATSTNAMTTEFGDSDMVVLGDYQKDSGEWVNEPLTQDDLDTVASTQGVATVSATSAYWFQVTAGQKSDYVKPTFTSEDDRLVVPHLDTGAVPTQDGQVALDANIAERLEVSDGDTITMLGGDDTSSGVSLTVTGTTSDPSGAFVATGGGALMTPGTLQLILDAAGDDSDAPFSTLMFTVDDDAVPATIADALAGSVDGRPVLTIDQYAEQQLSSLTGQANIMTMIVLMFAAIALFVAGLVISNTFQVLVAQRAHTLALLRCVGANRKQIRNSVLVEATLLGVASSLAGILAGIGLVQGVLLVLTQLEVSTSIPDTVTIPLTAVWVPLVVGTLVTVLAALVPARIATKVSPLAALRPQEGAGEGGRRVGILRLITSGLLTVGGGALLAGSLVMAKDSTELGPLVAVGILGGALTFIGLITSSMLWMPKVVSTVGNLFNKLGAPAKLASANTMRNPRRTAATSTALFIGVTLVAMLSVGAATTRATMNTELDNQFPVDAIAETWGSDNTIASDADVERTVRDLQAIDGINTVAYGRNVALASEFPGENSDGYPNRQVTAVNPDEFRAALRDPSLAAMVTEGTYLLGAWDDATHVKDTASFWVAPTSNDAGDLPPAAEQPGYSNAHSLTIAKGFGHSYGIITDTDLDAILASDPTGDTHPTATFFIKVDDVNNAGDAMNAVRDYFGEDNVSVTGLVLEREFYQKAIDVMLLVLVGLLGVAVLIALIGVANTLSLSVIERRRESATLRAVGMSKRQLRHSLGIEGMLIAGIGAFVGVLVGALYAWLGAQLLFGGFATPIFTVRIWDIVLIMAVSIGAGLLASVVPARGAARTSPVAALAVE